MPKQPIFTTPSPAAHSLEVLRKHFPQAVETDTEGRIRINAAALQIAIDPANPTGVQVEEDGFELRWVGKREAYHSAFVPVQKIVEPRPADSKNWSTTDNLLIKGDNIDALRLLHQSYFGKIKLSRAETHALTSITI
jgi:adenine-specific DNA-methyltransferase